MKTAILYYKSKNGIFVENMDNNSIIRIPSQAAEDAKENPNAAVLLNEILTKQGFWNFAKYGVSSVLQVMLSVSSMCNLLCTYCFEKEKKNIVLSRTMSNSFLRFVEEKMRCNNFNKIDVTFTGGEPLLNVDEIKYIVNNLPDVTGDQCALKYSLITNGTFYNQELLQLLQEFDTNIQVTLDGFRLTHNKYRVGNQLRTSFDLICENVDRILSETKCSVTIRVNAVTKNLMEYSDLLEFLHMRWGEFYQNGKLSHYFDFLDVEPDKTDLVFSSSEQLEMMYFISQKELALGFPIEKEVIIGSKCMMRDCNGYTIDADGQIYGCFSFIGDEKFAIGNITNQHIMRNAIPEYTCSNKDCSLYRKCYGGCIYSNYLKTGRLIPICQKEFLVNSNKILFAATLTQMGIAQFASLQEVLEGVFFDEIDI